MDGILASMYGVLSSKIRAEISWLKTAATF